MSQIIKKVMSIAIITTMVIMNFNCTILTTNAQEKDEYIVITKTDKVAEKIEDKYNVETDEALNGADNVLSGTLTEAQAEKLEDMKNVEVVEKDFTFEDSSEEDILPEVKPADDNWANKIVEATNTEQSGKKIKICIIDSGVDMTENFEIAERIDFIEENYGAEASEEYLEENENQEDEDDNEVDEFEEDNDEEFDDIDENVEESSDLDDEYEMTGNLPLFDDTCGHGTSIASVIAGTGTGSDVEGIAPNAELYSAKILDENREAPVSRAIKAIYWAIDKGMDIINLSFGTTTYSAALEQAVNDAADAGILVVASVGNNGNDGIDYPARCESTLSVGAINAAGEVCDFSSKGDKVDVVAPGDAITAQANFGEDMTLTGTSLATPYVTAIAADLWSKDTSKPAGFIKELIKASGKTITSSDGHEDKLIDYNYANEIYDEAYQAYLKKTGKVEENTEDVDKQETVEEETKIDSKNIIEDENASVDEVIPENVKMKEISSNEYETTPDEDKMEDEIQGSNDVKEEIIEDENNKTDVANENNQGKITEVDLIEDIEENTEEPQDLAEDVVKGSWKGSIHDENAKGKYMKYGAKFPDYSASQRSGMTNNPIFHAYTGDNLGTGKPAGDTNGVVNYVAAYRYIAMVAVKYKEGKNYCAIDYDDIYVKDDNTLPEKRYENIRAFLKKVNNGTIKARIKVNKKYTYFKNWNDSNQAAFLIGVAMHVATDPFAHSVFINKNGKIVRMPHHDDKENGKIKKCYSDCCDQDNKPHTRYKMAIGIEQNIVNRINNKRTGIGYGRDLFVNLMKNTDNYKKFRINKLKAFAKGAKVLDEPTLDCFGKLASSKNIERFDK